MPEGRLATVAAVVVLSAVGGAATAVAVEASGVGERIPEGVRVDGVDVGGLSPAEASLRLELHAHARAARPVLVRGPGRTIETSGDDLGAEARIGDALAAASAGRIGPIGHWLGRGRRREVRLRFELSPGRVRTLAARLGGVAAGDAELEVGPGGVRVRPARAGRTVDVAALRDGLSTLPPRLRARTLEAEPRVTTADAEAAAARARRLIGRPRTVLVGSERHTLTPANLREALTIRRAEHGFTIGFDAVRLGRLLPAPTLPRNAELRVEGDRVRVIPSVPGFTVDAAATARALTGPGATVRAVAATVRPSVTTSDLAALGIRERVSSFATRYAPGQPRVVNIRRAAAVIDGTILQPGETFSMNAALGERTVEKGYVPAPQIVGSSYADSVGGGISQVATMLYNGAFFAGLELIEHRPHSLYIDRYPLGREATISWGGPELIFRNDWPAAVLIDLEATSDSITIQFFSSRLGRRVETETSVPYGHGGGSFTVEYTRRVYRGDRLTRDERYRVSYGAPGGAVRGGGM